MWFLSLVLIGLFLRYVGCSVSPISLLEELRVLSKRARTIFCITFATELCAIALLVPIVATHLSPSDVGMSEIWDGLNGLYHHESWFGLVTGTSRSREIIIVSAMGLSFDAAVISAIIRALFTKRTDAETRTAAATEMLRGEFENAASTLREIDSPDVHSVRNEAIIYLSTGDVINAKKAMSLVVLLKKGEPSNQNLFVLLAVLGIINKISTAAWEKLFQDAIANGVHDLAIAIMLLTIADRGSLSSQILGSAEDIGKRVSTYPITLDLLARIVSHSD